MQWCFDASWEAQSSIMDFRIIENSQKYFINLHNVRKAYKKECQIGLRSSMVGYFFAHFCCESIFRSVFGSTFPACCFCGTWTLSSTKMLTPDKAVLVSTEFYNRGLKLLLNWTHHVGEVKAVGFFYIWARAITELHTRVQLLLVILLEIFIFCLK